MAEQPTSSLRLDTVTEDAHTTVLIDGDVDGSNASQLSAVIESISEDVGTIVLDMDRLRFLDSAGLGVLAGAIRRLNSVGGRLAVRNVPDNVEKVLEISDLLRFMVVLNSDD